MCEHEKTQRGECGFQDVVGVGQGLLFLSGDSYGVVHACARDMVLIDERWKEQIQRGMCGLQTINEGKWMEQRKHGQVGTPQKTKEKHNLQKN